MKKPDVELLMFSDCNYEKLVVEIYYEDKFIALLNQDDGLENLKIEFPPASGMDENMILRKVNLSILEKGISMAKKELGLDS